MFRVMPTLLHSPRVMWRALLHTTVNFNAIELKMPALSPTMETGTIVKWAFKPGDQLSTGDVLCEVQTDKAVMSLEVDEDGVLAHILVEEGGPEVPVGAMIAVIAEPGEDWKTIEKPAADAAAPAKSKPAAKPPGEGEKSTPPPKKASDTHEGRISHILGPAAKLLLEEYGVGRESLTPTGPFGVIMKTCHLILPYRKDVLDYIRVHKLVKAPVKSEEMPPAPVAPVSAPPPIVGPVTDIPLTSMRKTIAKRLTQSKQTIPHAYASIATDMKKVMAMRADLKANGIKVSVNDFIIKAVSAALLAVPSVNSTYENEQILLQQGCDICVAVATPNGLITPIVKDVQLLDLPSISNTVAELAVRARDGKLQPHEFQGGNFTISNLGMFGISQFSAIINPPQTALLAVGGSASISTLDGPVNRMAVTLCFDNRAISEYDAGRFLSFFRDVLESPEKALLGSVMVDDQEEFNALQGLL